MKNVSLMVAMSLFAPLAFADDPVPSPLVMVSAKTVFVPVGFDDNDQALAVVDGYLPNTCHKIAFNKSEFDEASNTFKVTQWARRSTGLCLDILVPFTAPVELGVISKGNFKVSMNGAETENLTVDEASSAGADDHLYAPIDSVRVEKIGEQYFGVIDGRFTNSCMAFSEIRVLDHTKTIEVLPIISYEAGAPGCVESETVFSKRFELPAGLPNGRHLLHVRSLNGKSANVVFGTSN